VGLQATTFNLSKVQQALGVRSINTTPNLVTADLVQSITVADMSKSFASESFEARALGTTQLVSTACLHSLGIGGIVIERLRVVGPIPIAGPAFQLRLSIEDAIDFPTPARKMDVGGQPTRSRWTDGGLATKIDASITLDSQGRYDADVISWFIPAKFSLLMETFPLFADIFYEVQWREIPQSAGPQ